MKGLSILPALGASLLVAGCFAPSYENGHLHCAGTQCPSGYHCAVANTCWRNGEDPTGGGGSGGGDDLGDVDMTGVAPAPDTTISFPMAGATTGISIQAVFDAPGSGITFECHLDGDAFAACSAPLSLGPLSGGSHTFYVRSVTTDGMRGAVASVTWTVDASGAQTMIAGTPATGALVNTSAYNFTLTSSPTDNVTFECKLDGGSFSACTTPVSGNVTADGMHTFSAHAIRLGVTGPDATVVWTSDTTAPVFTSLATVPATSDAQHPTNNLLPQIVGVTDANAPVTLYLTSGCTGASTGPVTSDGTGHFTIQTAAGSTQAAANAATSYYVRATDAAGNVSACTLVPAYYTDTVAPTVAVTQSSKPKNPTLAEYAHFSFSRTDSGTDSVTFQCKHDAPGAPGTFGLCSSTSATGGTMDLGSLAVGQHTFTVKIIDYAGNSSTDFWTWSVSTCTCAFLVDNVYGSDSNGGSCASPLKTVTHTMAVTGAPATTCLMPGIYSAANGETFPIQIPANVTVLGDEPSKGNAANAPTRIVGSGLIPGSPTKAAVVMAAGSTLAGVNVQAGNTFDMGVATIGNGVTIRNNYINGSNYGLWIINNTGHYVVGNSVTGNSGGGFELQCSGCTVSSARVENNRFVANLAQSVGFEVDSGIVDAGGGPNGSVGGNTMACNGRWDVYTNVSFSATNNFWDHSPPTSAVQAAAGTDIFLNTSSVVVTVSGSAVSPNPCTP